MDDGTSRGTFATNSFTYDEIILLKNWMLEVFDIRTTIQKQRKQFTLYIIASDRLKFEKMIFPYVVPSMYYKLIHLDKLLAQSV